MLWTHLAFVIGVFMYELPGVPEDGVVYRVSVAVIPDTHKFIQSLFRLTVLQLLAEGTEGPEKEAACQRPTTESSLYIAKESLQVAYHCHSFSSFHGCESIIFFTD